MVQLAERLSKRMKMNPVVGSSRIPHTVKGGSGCIFVVLLVTRRVQIVSGSPDTVYAFPVSIIFVTTI